MSKINQRSMASGKIPNSRQCRHMNYLTADISIMKSLDNAYYSVQEALFNLIVI